MSVECGGKMFQRRIFVLKLFILTMSNNSCYREIVEMRDLAKRLSKVELRVRFKEYGKFSASLCSKQ